MLAGEWWARKWSSPASVPYLGCLPSFCGAAFFVSTDWFVEGAQLCQCCRCMQGTNSLPTSTTDMWCKRWKSGASACTARASAVIVCRPSIRIDLIPSDVQHHLRGCFHSFSSPRERAVSRTPESSLIANWGITGLCSLTAESGNSPDHQKRSFPVSGIFFSLISGLSYFLNASACA